MAPENNGGFGWKSQKDSQKAIDFYKRAFGAKVLDVFPSLNGCGIMHATLQIGESIIMMGDEMPGGQGRLVSAKKFRVSKGAGTLERF
jgi:uncharacterized glyoxalase superfamily protein PhnB